MNAGVRERLAGLSLDGVEEMCGAGGQSIAKVVCGRSSAANSVHSV
jgi:hypothetical protein